MALASSTPGLSARVDGGSLAPGSLPPLQRWRRWSAAARSPPRQRAVSVRALGSMAMPVVTEVAKRALAVSASGSLASNSAAQLTYLMHHQTLMFFSLLGTLSVSIGAWCIALARVFWEQYGEQIFFTPNSIQEKRVLHGVDVSGSAYLTREGVLAAADFAAKAHAGQMRRTGHPYIMHCVETACIVEGLLSTLEMEEAENDERSELSMTAALLHDVIDDTRVDITEVEAAFGSQTATLVATVTRLSQMNQLMRRKARKAREQGVSSGAAGQPAPQEDNELRNMILIMVEEPLAILIKLADRLHNMRTVYALAPAKAQAVALETQRIWCSLAERLGMFALKSELEDLCFAVLQPAEFRRLRHELDVLWGTGLKLPKSRRRTQSHSGSGSSSGSGGDSDMPSSSSSSASAGDARSSSASASSDSSGSQSHSRRNGMLAAPRRLLGRAVTRERSKWPNNPLHLEETGVQASTSAILTKHQEDAKAAAVSDEEDESAADARSSSGRPAKHPRLSKEQKQMKQLIDSVQPFDQLAFKSHGRVALSGAQRRGLDTIDRCGRQLLQELQLNGCATGLDIRTEGRLKSLYSTYKKMQRKGVGLEEIYDARALRVIINDGGNRQNPEAMAACYQVQAAALRLWKPIAGERDDYIANPKGSGKYQSLHMAVVGPGGVPMEVQLRTSSMHQDAEYGPAAHWAYKELGPAPEVQGDNLRVGQPVLRVGPDGMLLDGVIMGVERGGQELTVAIACRGRLAGVSEGGHSASNAYRRLAAYVEMKKWSMPGQGDSQAAVQSFVRCRDGAFHMKDAYGYNHPTTVVPLRDVPVLESHPVPLAPPPRRPSVALPPPPEPVPAPASPLAQLAGAVPAGGSATPLPASRSAESAASPADRQREQDEREIARKTLLLRAVLEWGNEMDADIGDTTAATASHEAEDSTATSGVIVLMWPPGEFKRLPRGTTAGHIIKTHGLLQISGRDRSGLVNVNNRLVPETTPLSDGDLVIISDELLSI